MEEIQFVLAYPSRQKIAAERLREYCLGLDGTNIKLIPIPDELDQSFIAKYPNNKFACLQALGFNYAANLMKGKPFGWIEVDAFPLKKGWASSLSREYHRLGKPYMLSSDSHPPGDLVGGIGIMGPHAADEVPIHYEMNSWDTYLIQSLSDKVSRTSLIQHKYGIYEHNSMRKSRDLTFPRDESLIRKDAVLFHRDPRQTYIIHKPSRTKRFHFSNDMGDIIAALPFVRQMGGGHITIGNHPKYKEWGWREMKGMRFEALKPLLEAQSYIKSVEYSEDLEGVDYNFLWWREEWKNGQSLAHSQAIYFGIDKLDVSPWIQVNASLESKGLAVLHRSPRYHNSAFPWWKILKKYKNRALFVGTKEEYEEFPFLQRRHIQHRPCQNFLELAEIIKGSEIFIGNQSSPFWVAVGLGHPLIQESYLLSLDSIIERPNAQYVSGNRILL